MGNELNNGSGILKENTSLSLYIKDVLLNKYNFGDDVKFKNFLKKRACCTNNSEVPISLPVYNTTTDKIYPMTLKVRVFPNTVTSDLCNFDQDVFYTSGPFVRNNQYIMKGTCTNFYSDFCDNVYKSRPSDKLYEKSYGPYKDNKDVTTDPILKELYVTNPFEDCNCINSVYRKGGVQLNDGLSIDEMAQNFDDRCKTDFTRKFIASYESERKTCNSKNNKF